MQFFRHIISSYFANFIAFIAASYIVPGFEVTNILQNLLWVVAIFTIINAVIGPIIKSLLTPLIIVTFGLFIIAINAAMLWLLDFLSPYITINGTLSLVYTTLIISFLNVLINILAKKK